MPVSYNDGEMAIEDFKSLLNRLKQLTKDNAPVPATEVVSICDKIISFYEKESDYDIEEEKFPPLIGIMQEVEDRLE